MTYYVWDNITRKLKRLVTLRGLRLFVQRGRRGFSDEDIWSFDYYISQVLGEGVKALQERSHSYPGQGDWDTPEKWEHYLDGLSLRLLSWWNADFADDEARAVTREAVIEFGENFGHFWD